MNEAYPLQWPIGRARTDKYRRKNGNFAMPSGRIRTLLSSELHKMRVNDYVVSSNVAIRRDGLPYAGQKNPEDPGVVLYFTRNGKDIAISCDRYHSVDANLRAIGLTIEAIRGMERWGTEEMVDRAFTGFAALPESTIVTNYKKRAWYEVLEVSQTASPEVVKAAYRQKMMKAHPDHGGSEEEFAEVQAALDESGVGQ